MNELSRCIYLLVTLQSIGEIIAGTWVKVHIGMISILIMCCATKVGNIYLKRLKLATNTNSIRYILAQFCKWYNDIIKNHRHFYSNDVEYGNLKPKQQSTACVIGRPVVNFSYYFVNHTCP